MATDQTWPNVQRVSATEPPSRLRARILEILADDSDAFIALMDQAHPDAHPEARETYLDATREYHRSRQGVVERADWDAEQITAWLDSLGDE